MKKWIFCVILLQILTSPLFAIDEDTYIQFVADSVITVHKLKGNPKVMEMWADEMKKKYPDFMNQDWQSFEETVAEDSALKARVYNKILENVRSKGYSAHILDMGGGNTTIEIIEE